MRRAAVRRAAVTRRGFLGQALLAAAVVLPASLAGVVPGHAAATKVVEIVLKNGKVAGKSSVRVTRGDTVVLRWVSDRPLELHLHGYDVTAAVSPGAPAEMKVAARATGRFPVEIHGQRGSGGHHEDRAIFHLEVYPD